MGINGNDGDDVNGGDFGLSQVNRIRQSMDTLPAAQKQLRLRLQQAQEVNGNLDKIPDNIYNDPNHKLTWDKMRAKSLETTRSVIPRLKLFKESQNERFNSQAVNAIGRGFSDRSIGGIVSAGMNTSSAQNAGMGMSSIPFEDLGQRRDKIQGQLNSLGARSTELAGNLFNRNGYNEKNAYEMQRIASQAQHLTKQLIPLDVAQSQQKALGLDPASRQRSLLNSGERAESFLGKVRAENDVASKNGLGALSGDKLREKEVDAATKLVQALKSLTDQTGKTEKEIANLKATAADAAQEMKEIGDIKTAGGGGRSGSSALQNIGTIAGGVGQITSIGASALETLNISHPLQQVENARGFANIENQKYDTYRNALNGDMSSRMMMGAFSGAEAFGKGLGESARTGQKLRLGAGIATGVIAAAQTGMAIKSTLNPIEEATSSNQVNMYTQAAGTAAESAAMIGIAGSDLIHNLSGNRTRIGATNASLGLSRELNHVQAFQAQSYRDYAMGLGGAAINMGSAADGFLNEAAGKGHLNGLGLVGQSMGDYNQLASFGSTSMGSMFSASNPMAAKGFENRGLGSAQENMQRMASLASTGLNNPEKSLGAILEIAVAKGMGNSQRSLTAIAEHTAALVGSSTTRSTGIDTTSIVAQQIAGSINQREPNKEFATQQAISAQDNIDAASTNTSASFAGMQNVASLGNALRTDQWNAHFLAKAKISDIVGAKRTDKSAQAQWLWSLGFDASKSKFFQKDHQGFMNKFVEQQTTSGLMGELGESFTGAAPGLKPILNWLQSGDSEQKLEQVRTGRGIPKSLQEAVLAYNQSTGNSQVSVNRLKNTLVKLGQSKQEEQGSTTYDPSLGVLNGDTALGQIQTGKSLGANQQTDAAKQGSAIMSNAAPGAFAGYFGKDNLNGVFKSDMDAKNSTGGKSEGDWSTIAAQSAKDFGASATQLNTASGKLVEAANYLMKTAKGDQDVDMPDHKTQTNSDKVDKNAFKRG